MSSFSLQEIGVRLFLAAALGAMIGLERQRRNHPAGLRTHTLVSLGSALIMLMSEDIALRYIDRTNADPARIAAQVVSGIGFLGAGTIMREGLTVRGLTTAASLWVVAAIGLAIGGGYYIPAALATLISLGTLALLNHFEHVFLDKGHYGRLRIVLEDAPGRFGEVAAALNNLRVDTHSIHVQQGEGGRSLDVELLVKIPHGLRLDDLTGDIIALGGVEKVDYEVV